ncbi:MAG TPA: multidrug efflux RND transporter permease subunit [Phycisphaerae bacterium]|nr:multidrug efflux RND transporter permease subunit [Phycisphaerae bacterium]HRY66635.1 multidrug efflux RND transporter permease subunit [Phycisphaerae bacterium]
MISRFFIDRPIFAAVLSIVITIAGVAAFTTLPIAQYPEIAPPTVQVSCAYPGANARVVAETIAAPIEQQVNGVENMLYMSSQCTNDGVYSLTVTFKLGTNLDMAQVLVQNRVSLALPTLPDVVKQTGVTTKKKSPSVLLVVNLLSPDGRYDQLHLSNYATTQIKDHLARLDGVGDVTLFGQQDYSMRVWLNPEKLAARNLTADDVTSALKEQNVQVAAGQIGQPPVKHRQDFQYTMSTLGRLTDPEQFGEIIVKTGSSGQISRLRDIAEIELGAKSQDQSCSLDGKPSVGLAIFQSPGSNALATADRLRAKMEELKKDFPEGLDYSIVYDTTPFVRESIHEVGKALRDAFILVAIVVLVFLQNWRSTLIPLIAVPVSLVGTFGVMALLGFSLNNLSLFGLVLAIGVVVDDAIVVVENVERWIEHGLSPREAAYRSMEEVTVAVIAIAFGLSAVFIPTAFISGISGQFYRQFALTIATSTLISAFNSLTLSPALAALLLKPREQQRDILTRVMNLTLGWFFKGFNWLFGWMTAGYGHTVRFVIRGAVVALLVFGCLLYATYYGLVTVPTGFIPTQDKGYLIASVQLPDSASLQRTQDVLARVDAIARGTKGVKHTVAVAGQSFLLGANGSNFGSLFIVLDDFENRPGRELYSEVIAMKLRRTYFVEVQDAVVGVFGAPPVDGLGTAGGFKIMLQDRGSNGLAALQEQTDNLVARANQQPGLAGVTSMFRANTPQLYVDVDRVKCKTLGVPLNHVFNTLQANLGGLYVNDFNQFDRTWQVNIQADSSFRSRPEDVAQLKVRNAAGNMVPLGAVAKVEEVSGPVMVNRYNMFPAASINGATQSGFSSGQAIEIMEQLAAEELPHSMKAEWTELTYLEILAGNTAVFIFPLCVLFVFLTHSAEYESWLLPLAIILIAPLSISFALLGVSYFGISNNIFVQIGFVVLVGLACKNAVLIVEFAKQQHEHGKPPRDAAVEASRLRLRPILMTSFAFILGVVPLATATGAGMEMRRTLGIAVLAGMLGVTICGLLLTPVFYAVLQGLAGRLSRSKTAARAADG